MAFLSVGAVTQPANGTLSPSGSGIWTYTPNPGFLGTDAFTYRVTDGKGGSMNVPVSISVRKTYTSSPALALKDASTTTSSLLIADIGIISDINVRLSITHPALTQLQISLISPTGIRVGLVSGLTGANLSNTLLDEEAAKLITAGAAPYAGTFRPITSLANLDGSQMNDTWTLEIIDTQRKSTGTLNSWSLLVEKA